MTARKATVRRNREMVSLFGRFIRPEFASNRDANQVIIGVADDFHTGKLAEWQPAADINAAINVWRIGFASRHKVAAAKLRCVAIGTANQAMLPRMNAGTLEFFGAGLGLDEHFDCAAHKTFRDLACDFAL